jgi:hypothetical protein
MDVEAMLDALNRRGTDYLLIGGMNFLFRHEPVATFDVDVWIEDTPDNRARCRAALVDLEATWGETEAQWAPVAARAGDWLTARPLFCLLTRYGPLDVFRHVTGLRSWPDCAARAVASRTGGGVPYRGLADEDMLACQLALDEPQRNLDRIQVLRRALNREERP